MAILYVGIDLAKNVFEPPGNRGGSVGLKCS